MNSFQPASTPNHFSLPADIKIKHLPFKRIFDISFSLLVLFCGALLYLFLALCIMATSRGGAIYAQPRIGRGGRVFYCYKFRTMHANAEDRLSELLASDPAKQEEWLLNHKLKNDPRITPIGKILRQTSLDELPQFWNVLIGDLSVVGPRAVVAQELATHFGEKALKILSVRPGLTGLWQVSGRSDTSYEMRVCLDELYVDSQSMKSDLWLIFKTIPCLFHRRGAY